MRRLQLLTTAALGAAICTPVGAQEQTALPEVVVTAARLPAIQHQTPGARVIDRDAIDRRGARFAADILSDVPGVSVARSGAFGGVAQARIRGAGPGKTLVLVDGVPVNDPSEVNGAFDLGGFDLSDVERVEVLSGPQSSLWGSDAIGGVIAFTTRAPRGLSAEVEAGSFETVRGRVSAGFAEGRRALGLTVSGLRSDGIPAAEARDGNPERDGLESATVNLRGRWAALDGGLRWSKLDAERDGYPPPAFALSDTDERQKTDSLSAFVRLRGRAAALDHQLMLAGSGLERETVSPFMPDRYEGERRLLRWQADGRALAETLSYAVGAEREETSGSLSTGEEAGLATTSAFALGRLQVTERLSLSAALRHDATDDFGGETTGRASAAWAVGGGLVLSGAYGTGFKAPSISQAVCDFCFSSQPFPRLKPETAEGAELALGWRAPDGRVEARATAYRLTVKDQIAYRFDPVTFDSFYENIARARTDGVELEGRARLAAGWDVTAAYAWTDAVDASTGERLLRVPEHAGSATLGWTGARLRAALTVRAEGDQDDFGGVREGFVTAALNAGWDLNERVEVFARVENLSDQRHQQVLGYGEPGRSGYLGLRLRY